ncbi:Methylenetetrahydrofolate dehydrogenase [NAD(+)] [Durusdinium trenchii]|uniref:Methylenetetrahydrofolate dehydrogenase [NAD(+)] n=1 Tax=Durusdinium trenchii TaxID=1381693 RepID=A0ABP0R6D5_9DINO
MGGVGPKLVGFLANTDPAAKKYAEWTGKAMSADNLRFELREVQESNLEDGRPRQTLVVGLGADSKRLAAMASPKDKEELEKANKEVGVDGIMIYYPVFGQRPSFHGGSHDDYLRDTDAEGLNHFYRRALYQNKRYVDSESTKKCVLPCTPLAVAKSSEDLVKTLEHLQVYDPSLPVGERMTGKTAVVVNRSEVVGRPVAAMLACGVSGSGRMGCGWMAYQTGMAYPVGVAYLVDGLVPGVWGERLMRFPAFTKNRVFLPKVLHRADNSGVL